MPEASVPDHYDLLKATCPPDLICAMRWPVYLARNRAVYPRGSVRPDSDRAEFIEIVVERRSAQGGDDPLRPEYSRACRSSFPMITAALVYLAHQRHAGQPDDRADPRKHGPLQRKIRRIRRAAYRRRQRPSATKSARRNASLAHMQRELAEMLQQKEPAGGARAGGLQDQSRSAQHAFQRAAYFGPARRRIKDPTVQRFAPKLVNSSLDRAIRLCTETR